MDLRTDLQPKNILEGVCVAGGGRGDFGIREIFSNSFHYNNYDAIVVFKLY